MVVTYLIFNLSLCELFGAFLMFLAVGLASNAPLSPSNSAGLFTYTHNPPLLHSHSLLHSHPPLIDSGLQLVSQLNLLRIDLRLDPSSCFRLLHTVSVATTELMTRWPFSIVVLRQSRTNSSKRWAGLIRLMCEWWCSISGISLLTLSEAILGLLILMTQKQSHCQETGNS